jgi:hypothetical protein
MDRPADADPHSFLADPDPDLDPDSEAKNAAFNNENI